MKRIFSEEHRKHLSEANRGKIFSDERRRHISEALKGRAWNRGKNGKMQWCAIINYVKFLFQ